MPSRIVINSIRGAQDRHRAAPPRYATAVADVFALLRSRAAVAGATAQKGGAQRTGQSAPLGTIDSAAPPHSFFTHAEISCARGPIYRSAARDGSSSGRPMLVSMTLRGPDELRQSAAHVAGLLHL